MSQRRILMLGHGAMGHLFEQRLSGHELTIWERDPDNGDERVVPAHPHRALAEENHG